MSVGPSDPRRCRGDPPGNGINQRSLRLPEVDITKTLLPAGENLPTSMDVLGAAGKSAIGFGSAPGGELSKIFHFFESEGLVKSKWLPSGDIVMSDGTPFNTGCGSPPEGVTDHTDPPAEE